MRRSQQISAPSDASEAALLGIPRARRSTAHSRSPHWRRSSVRPVLPDGVEGTGATFNSRHREHHEWRSPPALSACVRTVRAIGPYAPATPRGGENPGDLGNQTEGRLHPTTENEDGNAEIEPPVGSDRERAASGGNRSRSASARPSAGPLSVPRIGVTPETAVGREPVSGLARCGLAVMIARPISTP